jgi:hypothetical protein
MPRGVREVRVQRVPRQLGLQKNFRNLSNITEN